METPKWKHRGGRTEDKIKKDCCVDVIIIYGYKRSYALLNFHIYGITSGEDDIGTKLPVTSRYCVSYQYYLHILSFVCIEY